MDKVLAIDGPVVLDCVPCTVCQHDVPLSEAVVPEAVDYVIYFCSLDCYERWRESAGRLLASPIVADSAR